MYQQNDCVQWIIENSPKSKPWTVTRVVHEVMALWFGSVHITATVSKTAQHEAAFNRSCVVDKCALLINTHQTACFVLFDLCLHPEYIPPLREEIEKTGWQEFDQSSGKAFPLMDSFMKESARLTPVESGGFSSVPRSMSFLFS